MSVRLDKWLWAARFYKTRALAKKAIEGGKVHFQGQKTKVSKTVNIGDKYQVQQSDIKKIIVVEMLDEIRGPPRKLLNCIVKLAKVLFKEKKKLKSEKRQVF
jgi:ribosome-associated heat shock protein Hsp15